MHHDKNNIFLHIGYHKTGTTYLQKEVFSKLKTINYLGRPWREEELRNFFADYKYTNDLQFNADETANKFVQIVEKILEDNRFDSSLPVFISHESLLTGAEWFGLEVASRARRLKNTFPNAKLIISFRNQADFIESNYRNYVIHGGKLSFDSFLKNSFAGRYAMFPRLYYDQVFELYSDIFGSENIHVYLHEELRGDPEKTIRELFSFLQVSDQIPVSSSSVNTGVGRFSTLVIRYMNYLLAEDFTEQYYRWTTNSITKRDLLRRRLIKLIRFLHRAKKPNRVMNAEQRTKVQKIYRQSNQRLQTLLQKDLRLFSYFPEK